MTITACPAPQVAVPPSTCTRTVVDDSSVLRSSRGAEVDRRTRTQPLHGSTDVHRSVSTNLLERGRPAPHQRTVEGELNPELAPDLGDSRAEENREKRRQSGALERCIAFLFFKETLIEFHLRHLAAIFHQHFVAVS